VTPVTITKKAPAGQGEGYEPTPTDQEEVGKPMISHATDAPRARSAGSHIANRDALGRYVAPHNQFDAEVAEVVRAIATEAGITVDDIPTVVPVTAAEAKARWGDGRWNCVHLSMLADRAGITFADLISRLPMAVTR